MLRAQFWIKDFGQIMLETVLHSIQAQVQTVASVTCYNGLPNSVLAVDQTNLANGFSSHNTKFAYVIRLFSPSILDKPMAFPVQLPVCHWSSSAFISSHGRQPLLRQLPLQCRRFKQLPVAGLRTVWVEVLEYCRRYRACNKHGWQAQAAIIW